MARYVSYFFFSDYRYFSKRKVNLNKISFNIIMFVHHSSGMLPSFTSIKVIINYGHKHVIQKQTD